MARYPNASDVRIETQRPLSVRKTRRPQHSWALAFRPWQIQPCMIAQVLPGETLKSASIQMRVVSDPIISNVQGWWLELYLFYVRIGDLLSPMDQAFRNEISNPGSGSFSNDSVDWHYNHGSNTAVNITKACTAAIVRAYFRKEGEDATTSSAIVDGLPVTRVAGTTWLDSLYTDSDLGTPTGADQWALNWSAFQQLRDQKLTTNTFEEYLSQMGVSTPPKLVETTQDFQIPELVRFVRDYAFPVPTVNQTTGAIVSTVQWSLAERVDKRRFFAEPGWLIGLVVARPKVYFANQVLPCAHAQGTMGLGWMAPAFDTDPHMTLNKWATGASGPLAGKVGTTTYWTDLRDPLLHGDQFVNQNPASFTSGTSGGFTLVTLPSSDLSDKRYPTFNDARTLFVDNKTDGTGVSQWLHADGVCSLRIASRLGAADTSN